MELRRHPDSRVFGHSAPVAYWAVPTYRRGELPSPIAGRGPNGTDQPYARIRDISFPPELEGEGQGGGEVSASVVRRLGCMLSAVDFNHQTSRQTGEIDDVRPDRNPATEPVALKLLKAQAPPQPPLGVGHLDGAGVRSCLRPTPLPTLPLQGGGRILPVPLSNRAAFRRGLARGSRPRRRCAPVLRGGPWS